ncbi:MAG: putative sulfate exporter family transporter, partial [Clostridia bacterium]|nr:putative sulfate exporter family transporter [Clostridia bacterium]
ALGMGDMGFIFAMIIGLIIGNFFLGFADYLKTAARPEWYIKTGIVILGASIAVKTLGAMGLATTVIVRGLCAVVEAYLVYWAVVYFIARKYFKFTPEWAAPLASGISICGVSAAIATGAAVRSRPVIPVILSAVIIVFVALELLFLPWLAQVLLWNEPMVAGAWMGLAVKSDGGAIASGAITDSLIRAKALKELGVNYEEGWMLMATTTTKVFIDIFIGVWAFILAVVWSVFNIGAKKSASGDNQKSQVKAREIWDRFPKFIIGFVLTFFVILLLGLSDPSSVKGAEAGSSHANALRSIFFGLCFFSIGLVTNVRKLWQEGMGRIVAVYAVALFGFILWVGLLISWIFYHGIYPPVV